MARLHLISGLPCSGKTTYATALRADIDAVLFSLDRWLITTFGRYEIASIGHQEHTRRVLACRDVIWSSASEFLRRSVDVILDDGFFLREHRLRYIALGGAVGAGATIHYIDTPVDVMRVRLEKRNSALPAFNFYIDPATLIGFSALFEAPTRDEGANLVVVRDPADRRITDVQ